MLIKLVQKMDAKDHARVQAAGTVAWERIHKKLEMTVVV